MKKLFLIFGLLCLSTPVFAVCTYGTSTGGKSITVNFSGSIIADATLPNGSILASSRRGNVTPKPMVSCAGGDVYVVRTVPAVMPSNITKINGKIVYETGIPGIGFQISDILLPSVRDFNPADIDQPDTASNHYSSTGSGQVMVWLVKTGPITKTPGSNITVYFMGGSPDQTSVGSSNAAELFRIYLDLQNLKFKDTTCNITPKGSNIVNLQRIDLSEIKAISVGKALGKAKNIALNITCPDTEVNKKYIYWFSPVSQASQTDDGVLLNSLANGAKNIGIIIKQNSSAIKFNDLKAYPFTSTKNKELNLTADYYRIDKNVSVGETGDIKVDMEVILQEE
ncbi:fimbrial protein [Klebsiella grimontii]|uniref:fimbrial protein n=1 Tax=Klebsiella grimontii TaxID=2058152 RepID=UPI001CCE0D6A|nr:fimbrial protein [Klebsiella grimontii]MBZ7673262.1 fimbrial protein [Klebsiella grimontii]